MAGVIGERIFSAIPLIIPLVLVIDLVYDLIRWIFFKDEFWHVFHDFLRVFVIGAVIYFCSNYLYTLYDFDYGIEPRLIMNRAPLNSYEYPSDEIKEISELIKEEYDINVYVDVDVNDVYGDIAGYVCSYGTDEEKALTVLNKIYSMLGKYNESALKKMPDNFYIVESIEGARGLNSSKGYLLHDKDFIILSTLATNETVDHEIMHSLGIYLPIKDEAYMFEHFKEGCSLVSDYACTSRSEFLSETWKKSFDMENDNEYYDLIRKSYKLFLKDFSSENITALTETSERYNALNEREKNVYNAIYSIKEGKGYTVSADYEEVCRGFELFRNEHPEYTFLDKLSVYGDGEEYTIYFAENFSRDYETEREVILSEVQQHISEFDGLSDYDKLLSSYTEVMNRYSDSESDEIYRSFKGSYPELLLGIYFKELGYYSVLKKLDSSTRALIVEINGKYYWASPKSEHINATLPRFFLVDDETMRSEGIDIPDSEYVCDDMSLCYAGQKGLYLTEFDRNAIDRYVIREIKKPAKEISIYIQCRTNELAVEVSDYLIKTDSLGYRRLNYLWFNNVSSYMPGFMGSLPDSNSNDRILHCYDFIY